MFQCPSCGEFENTVCGGGDFGAGDYEQFFVCGTCGYHEASYTGPFEIVTDPDDPDPDIKFSMKPVTRAETYFEQMTPFFQAKAHKEKGASWKTCSIGYLLDGASKQFEDLGNRPGEEDYMANLANYAYMLWRHEQAAQGKLPLTFEEASGW